MKLKMLSIFFMILSILGCKEEEEEDKKENSQESSSVIDYKMDTIAPPRKTTIPTRQCYVYIENNDTVSLNLEQTNNRITGDLAYLWAEKDQNTGSISGTLKGDTIFADYTFVSEGKESVREVVFLKQDNQVLEGYAPVTESDGKIVFSNNKFNFSKSPVLKRTDCRM